MCENLLFKFDSFYIYYGDAIVLKKLPITEHYFYTFIFPEVNVLSCHFLSLYSFQAKPV